MKTKMIRLNKYIADSGITSRRKADELIDSGKVIVNGKKVFELGIKINPETDSVKVSGKTVNPTQNKVYIMFHKPAKVVTTMSDPLDRPTIKEFFYKIKTRIFPVGRLDWDTEGLLLLSNDGDWAQKITHPKHQISKTYLVKVSGHLSPEKAERLLKGVSIPGGKVRAQKLQIAKNIPGKKSTQYDWVRLVIHEGKYHQIKKMFEKVGLDVKRLQRIAIGRLKIGHLPKGHYKHLTKTDIAKIFSPLTKTTK